MPVPSALTTTQKNNLRAERYQSRTYLALNPNTVVGTARINQSSFGASVAQLTFDTASDMSSTLVGQTVLISKTNNMRDAYFRGRVRKPVSGSTLFINETSTKFNDDDYIFVINDVALHTKLPRSSGGVEYIDYDVTFRQMLPIVYNLQSAYVITLNSSSQADLALSPLAYATTEGATISSWSWSAPSATFQVGSSTTQNVTLRWTSAGVYWVRLTVTDNGSRSNFITFPVFVCSADYSDSFIQTGVDNLVINGNEAGYTCTINAFDGVSNVLDQTLAVIFSVEKINTSSTPIVSNVNFVGRLRNNTVATDASIEYVRLQDTNITIEDIVVQMGRCPIVTWSWTDDSSPNVWGEINALTIWRALVSMVTDFSTLSNVSSIQFDSISNTFRTYDIDQSDTALLDGMNKIADTINARITSAPQGEIYIFRSARFLSPSARNSLTKVMDFELQDMTNFTIDTDPAKLIGRQISYGGSYNTTSKDMLILEAIAPAVAPAEGVGQNETVNQVLSANLSITNAQIEIGERVANDFETRNQITKINVTLHDGFHFIVPCNFQWYTFTIPSTANNRGLSYTSSNRWLLESVQAVYRNEVGTWDVSGTFAIETMGGNYQIVAQIAPNEQPFYLAPYPIDDAYPNFPDENPYYIQENPEDEEKPNIDKNDTQPINNPSQSQLNNSISGGDVVVVWNGANVWLTKNYTKTKNPDWQLIFSSSDSITDFKFAVGGTGAYVLTNNGTNSTFWRTNNVFAGSPTWLSTAISGVYKLIRTTDTAGEVYILSHSASWTHTFDFTTSSHGTFWIGENGFIAGQDLRENCVWVSGEGWGQQRRYDGARQREWAAIEGSFSTTNIYRVSTVVKFVAGTGGSFFANNYQFRYWNGTSWIVEVLTAPATTTAGTFTFDNTFTSITTNKVRIYVEGYQRVGDVNPNGDTYIQSVTFYGTGVNPFSSTYYASTRRSIDSGATFSSIVDAGVVADLSGIDTQRIGNLVFVGTDEKIREAIDGGSYSDTTHGATTGTFARLIRTYGQSGTKLVFGTNAPISGNTLWKIDSGLTAITPNDGSHNGLVVGDNCVDMWITSDNIIIGIFNFGGTYKLARSTNGGSSWSFVTTNINSGSKYLRVRQSDTKRKQVYLFNSDNVLYSSDGGVTTQVKTAPSSSLIGIEVKS